MRYLLILLLLTGCSIDLGKKESSHQKEELPKEEAPIDVPPVVEPPEEPVAPPPEEQPPVIEPKKCIVDLYWTLYHPMGNYQILEYESFWWYRTIRIPASVQHKKFEFKDKGRYCFRSNLYDIYNRLIMSTNIWCQECYEEDQEESQEN